ncbi:MAG TPA: hypothetical protein VFW09_06300 [Solirubrobacteraceae bacterium]|nr:hypothetical protein [Solirubrobacteraceae bacterium]
MVSFQQQWEAAMSAEVSARQRPPLRHAAMLLAIALVLITVPTIALARATDSHSSRAHGCVGAHATRHACVHRTARVTVRP